MPPEERVHQSPYNYYCVVCGNIFHPIRRHSITCSDDCRAVRNLIEKKMNFNPDEGAKPPVDKEVVAEQYKKVAGKEVPKKLLDQYPSKDPAPPAPGVTKKLFGGKKVDKTEAKDKTEKPDKK